MAGDRSGPGGIARHGACEAEGGYIAPSLFIGGDLMATYTVKIDQGGLVRLPKELLDRFGAEAGHEIEFFVSLDDEIFTHFISGSAQGWKDLFNSPKRVPPLSVREMDEGMAEALVEADERSKTERGSDAAGPFPSAAE
jgi:bifunctional DNA-binding transcriptional regulator/antitoxin component of YhaV-PrlF toxin-antitoxin module